MKDKSIKTQIPKMCETGGLSKCKKKKQKKKKQIHTVVIMDIAETTACSDLSKKFHFTIICFHHHLPTLSI